MSFKHLLTPVVAAIALVSCALAGTAAAGSGAPCGAAAVFAGLGDQAGYVRIHSVANGPVTLLGSDSSSSFKASCVAFLEPVVRLVATNNGDPGSTLTVSVQYTDAQGTSHDDVIGTLTGAGSEVSDPLTFGDSGVKGNVQVTVSGDDSADWTIDGVYIDPFMSR